jgi:hypothetical protein
MVVNKIITYLLLIIIFAGCKNSNSQKSTISDKVNMAIKGAKSSFEEVYLVKNLFNIFPVVTSSDIRFENYGPVCPPANICKSQNGSLFLMLKDKKTLNSSLDSVIFYTRYNSDSNIIIDLPDLSNEVFIIKKCNVFHFGKVPIPYFEYYDFGLGTLKILQEKYSENGNTFINKRWVHNIPEDLQVYVVDAKSGDFWKESCNEKRPESLKEWQHGYSKGFAISEKENMLIYWNMIW